MISVTIHADASWSPRNQTSGWAVWIKSNVEKIVRSGTGPAYLTDNNEAELAAIYAGLHLISTRPWFTDLHTIYIRSDSLTALRWIQMGPRSGTHPGAQRLYDLSRKILSQIPDCRLDIKHTPGHRNPNHSTANWVNNKVDGLANAARRRHDKAERRMGATRSPVAPEKVAEVVAPAGTRAKGASPLQTLRRLFGLKYLS